MEVKPGYKQTDVGLIPADWEVKSANQICMPVRGGSPRPAGDPRYFNGSYIPWLTVASLTNIPDSKLVVSETASCLTEEGSFRSRTLHPGTLIVANSGATLGVAKILGVKCCANDGIAALLNLDKGVSPRYLAHYINTKTDYLRDIIASGNGQPNLNTELIGNLKFPLPPTKAEQEAIARALGDADALIDALEQLVAKKRQIKHGAMQELLTGQKRLPGFGTSSGYKQTEVGVIPEDWEVTTVGAEFSIQLGKMLDSEKNIGVAKPFLGNRAVQWGRFDLTDIGHIKLSPTDLTRFRLREGDLLVCEGGEVGRAAIWESPIEECYYQKALHRLRPKRDYNIELMLSMLQRLAATAFLLNFVTQTSIAHLPKDKFETVPIPLPPTKAEQEAIATILSDMDAEIAALEAKLVKARQVKQGMMQELLTGRVRLV